MGPNRSKISSKVFKLVLNFPPNGPHKLRWGFLKICVSECHRFIFKFQIHLCTYMEKPKTSIIWKTGDSRAKWGEICDTRGVIQSNNQSIDQSINQAIKQSSN